MHLEYYNAESRILNKKMRIVCIMSAKRPTCGGGGGGGGGVGGGGAGGCRISCVGWILPPEMVELKRTMADAGRDGDGHRSNGGRINVGVNSKHVGC